MMEVINDSMATVYRRENIDDLGKSVKHQYLEDREQEDYGQQIKWKISYRIKRYPKRLCSKTSLPYMFSPNFTYQLDFNYHLQNFVIRNTETQHIYMNIPNDLISTKWNEITGENAFKIITSRIKWSSENVLRVVNAANLDCLFQLSTTDPTDQNIDARYLKLISCVKVDNLFVNMKQRDEPHILVQQKPLEPKDVLSRLIRLN
jgi:hypothetical protein